MEHDMSRDLRDTAAISIKSGGFETLAPNTLNKIADELDRLTADLAAMTERAERAERKYIAMLGSQMHNYTCENRPDCDREWIPPKDMKAEQCPFCDLAATREKLRVAREGLERIERDPADNRTKHGVQEIAPDTLAQIKEATND